MNIFEVFENAEVMKTDHLIINNKNIKGNPNYDDYINNNLLWNIKFISKNIRLDVMLRGLKVINIVTNHVTSVLISYMLSNSPVLEKFFLSIHANDVKTIDGAVHFKNTDIDHKDDIKTIIVSPNLKKVSITVFIYLEKNTRYVPTTNIDYIVSALRYPMHTVRLQGINNRVVAGHPIICDTLFLDFYCNDIEYIFVHKGPIQIKAQLKNTVSKEYMQILTDSVDLLSIRNNTEDFKIRWEDKSNDFHSYEKVHETMFTYRKVDTLCLEAYTKRHDLGRFILNLDKLISDT